MQTVKLANVDIDDSEQYLSCPNLWVRCTDGGHLPTKRHGGEYGVHGFSMDSSGTYDFMTYYGALSLRKWVRYTEARDFELRQAYKDAAAQMHTRGAWERYLGLDADANGQRHDVSE